MRITGLAAGPVTLLTATRDVGHSQAAVLARLLQRRASAEPAAPAERRASPEPAEPHGPAESGESSEGGEAACYAHLVCPECGAVTTEGHRPGCSSA